MDADAVHRFLADFHDYDYDAHEREMDARHEYPETRRPARRAETFELFLARKAFRTFNPAAFDEPEVA